MAKRSTPASMSADTKALPESVNTALDAFIGQPRVSDLVMAYGGDKSLLAQELAGTSDKKSTAYKTQLRNVNRWLKSESGAEGQKRRPNAEAQEKFKQLMKKKQPPSGGTIDMHGYIYYDYDIRWRHITVSLTNDQTARVLKHIEAGNVHAAYGEIFSAYGAPHLEMGDDSPQISIDFS